jgi:hypothetical protein
MRLDASLSRITGKSRCYVAILRMAVCILLIALTAVDEVRLRRRYPRSY